MLVCTRGDASALSLALIRQRRETGTSIRTYPLRRSPWRPMQPPVGHDCVRSSLHLTHPQAWPGQTSESDR
jgi:hypothetical protein